MLLQEWWCGNSMGCQHCRERDYRQKLRAARAHSSKYAIRCGLAGITGAHPCSHACAGTFFPKKMNGMPSTLRQTSEFQSEICRVFFLLRNPGTAVISLRISRVRVGLPLFDPYSAATASHMLVAVDCRPSHHRDAHVGEPSRDHPISGSAQ